MMSSRPALVSFLLRLSFASTDAGSSVPYLRGMYWGIRALLPLCAAEVGLIQVSTNVCKMNTCMRLFGHWDID
jgi:hypothetical protein